MSNLDSRRRPAAASGRALATALAAGLTLAGTNARAADDVAAPAPAAEAAPAASPPPGGYPPPPPGGYPGYPPAPPRAYPPPPYYGTYRGRPRWYSQPTFLPEGIYRPISLTLAAGAGGLFGPHEHDLAFSYNLFRLGFGLAPNLSLYLSYEGAGAPSTQPDTQESSWLAQKVWSFGLQVHVLRRLYFRAGPGFAHVDEDTDSGSWVLPDGMAVTGGIGWELIQHQNFAFGVEATGVAARYPHQWWGSSGLNFTLALY